MELFRYLVVALIAFFIGIHFASKSKSIYESTANFTFDAHNFHHIRIDYLNDTILHTESLICASYEVRKDRFTSISAVGHQHINGNGLGSNSIYFDKLFYLECDGKVLYQKDESYVLDFYMNVETNTN